MVTTKNRNKTEALITILVMGIFFLCGTTQAAIPNGYYDRAAGKSGMELKTILKTIVSENFNSVSYSNCNAALKYIDASLTDSSQIFLHYKGAYVANTSSWNKEHLWPQSRGCGSSPMKSDLYNLFPEDPVLNSSRGNSVFTVVDEPSNTSCGNKWTSSLFEPRDDIKGDIARALFYMETRYADRGFVLVDETDISGTKMAVKTQLLLWNQADPVDTYERRRNDRVYEYQKNRNPYVDHPEYVDLVYGTVMTPYTDGDTLSVSSASLAPATAAAGTEQIPMLALAMRANSNEWDLGSLTVTLDGTLQSNSVTAIQLWKDANANGIFEAATDTPLASAVPATDMPASLALAAVQRITAETTTTFFLTASIGDDATSGSVVRLIVETGALTHSATGGADIDPEFATINSGDCLITSDAPPNTGNTAVVINKIYNSSTSDGTGDAVELLVLEDNTNLGGLWLKDFSSSAEKDNGGGSQFLAIDFWKNLKAGTLISLTLTANGTETPTTGNYTITASLNDADLFNYKSPFNLGSAEIVMIKSGTQSGTSGNIHALGYGFSSATQWLTITENWKTLFTTKVTQGFVYCQNSTRTAADFNRSDLAQSTSAMTFGAANNTDNQAFIDSLRGLSVSDCFLF